ncbi:MAG: hypothetical protein BGO96_08135 [Micrococcales bacterium 73-15]|nr:MAG: hypothetical protein BGO96_08135 [Micrococcales bacterium 73-15]
MVPMSTETSPATAADAETDTVAAPAVPSGPAAVVPRRSQVGRLAVTAIVVLLLDQLTKAVALLTLTPGVRVPVLGDLLGWQLIFNPGAAFSFGTGVTWVFTVVMAVVSSVVIVLARRVASPWWAVALGAILGGAMGNLVDRLARDPGFGIGHVVDFIDYGVFIGNVADIAIVGAAIGMVLLSLFGSTWDGAAPAPVAAEEPAAEPAAETAEDAGEEPLAAEPAAAESDPDAAAAAGAAAERPVAETAEDDVTP